MNFETVNSTHFPEFVELWTFQAAGLFDKKEVPRFHIKALTTVHT